MEKRSVAIISWGKRLLGRKPRVRAKNSLEEKGVI